MNEIEDHDGGPARPSPTANNWADFPPHAPGTVDPAAARAAVAHYVDPPHAPAGPGRPHRTRPSHGRPPRPPIVVPPVPHIVLPPVEFPRGLPQLPRPRLHPMDPPRINPAELMRPLPPTPPTPPRPSIPIPQPPAPAPPDIGLGGIPIPGTGGRGTVVPYVPGLNGPESPRTNDGREIAPDNIGPGPDRQ